MSEIHIIKPKNQDKKPESPDPSGQEKNMLELMVQILIKKIFQS